MGTTARGVPFVEDSDLVTDYPAGDEAQAEWINDAPGVSTMTTAERDALSGAALWNGRVIYNTTVGRLQMWNASAWVEGVQSAGGNWTPTIEGPVSTVPTSAAEGVYYRLGAVVTARGRFVLSAGAAGETTFWIGGLPYAPSSGWTVAGAALGSGYARDASTGLIAVLTPYWNSGASTVSLRVDGETEPAGDGFPWTWASGDEIHFVLTYAT